WPSYGGGGDAAVHDDGTVSVLSLELTLARIAMPSILTRFANRAAALLLALLLLNGALPSQPSDYTFHSESDVVLVNVTVRDKNGKFVPGLKPENFTILEDNKPQKIVSFDVENVDAVPALNVAQAKPVPDAATGAANPATPNSQAQVASQFQSKARS